MLACLFLLANVFSIQKVHPTAKHPATKLQTNATANRSSVPDVYAIPSHLDRIVVVRLKYGTDLLAGIQRMVRQEGIRNGVVLAGIGSVSGYQIDQASSSRLPAKTTIERRPGSPAELIGMNGYIIDGRVHVHITLATQDRAIGGHLQENTKVLTCAIVTIAVTNNADFNRIDDETFR